MKKYIYPAIIVPLLVFLISGCAWVKGYGKIRLQSGPGKKVTTQELEDNWHNYTIYYAGYYGGLSIKHPSAVMFDPKNDKRALVGDRWTKVQDQETLSRLISSIQSQKARYYPRLWRILGPDDQFYGYLFSAWRQVPLVIKVLDDKTMFVYDLPMPPYLEVPDLKYHLVSGKFQ
ncbi:MAG: hypothetical protein JSW35_08285 [Deltaproteobacteria bacterium]|nr:MAG: hypothetical protein JSW35_08285 [Deltaproteobacteria bacterium]